MKNKTVARHLLGCVCASIAWLVTPAQAADAPAAPAGAASNAGVFFDDFNYPSVTALVQQGGWKVRDQKGHPGISGAVWGPDSIGLAADPLLPGNQVMRLSAQTNGKPEATRQAQVCHARKFFEGTYAARVRFADAPVTGPDGDLVLQTFYLVNALRFDFDPVYSEIDWEYLANGGWGDSASRVYAVSWQTVQLEPWNAFNKSNEIKGSLVGWHTLVMQLADGHTRFFLDGKPVADQGGRNYPVAPMSINFNLWFSPSGVLPGTDAVREYQQDVDWVFHAKDRVISPQEVDAEIKALRKAGTSRVDTVPAANPPLPSDCNM